MPDYERFRIIIEEARSNDIIIRDLIPMTPVKIIKKLSGPCKIQFDLDPRHPSIQKEDGSGPIRLKPWGHWAHIEKLIGTERRIIASGIMEPSEVDPATGILHASFNGFSGYMDKMPWLENWNPIAVDPFEIFDRAWDHMQSYENGNLNVSCYNLKVDGTKRMPPVSNTLMLPGFSFDGDDFIMDFFAIFIRAVDFTPIGDYLNKLARDIPFDYFEESEWNGDRSAIAKYIQLAYPRGGVEQTNLTFRLGENVLQAKPKLETEIEWCSDLIIRGWFPGKVYSSQLANADPHRYRRTILEEDARINSDERTLAWAHRQLSRRQFPDYWESIVINMNHSHAPFGTWDVGDQILVEGKMPWVGEVALLHKITAWSVDEASQTCELQLKAEGAFNYDPIIYDGG